MSEEIRDQLWYLWEEPQFIPPTLGFVILFAIDAVPVDIPYQPSVEAHSMLVTVCVISSAAMIIERGIEEFFRRIEGRTWYHKSTLIEKTSKSGILLFFTAIVFNRPMVEGAASSSILLAAMAVLFYYIGLNNEIESLVVEAVLAVLTVMFAFASLFALWTTYLVIS